MVFATELVSAFKAVLCCRMPTISELVDESDIRVQGKDNVKRILHQLGYELEDAVGKAFLKITRRT